MKSTFLFFLLIMITNLVAASGFSPSSLTFKFNPGERECQMVSISSDSESISVKDSWAENKDEEWNFSSFEKKSSYHNLILEYDKELSIEEREVEVCISGSNEEEYHGVLLFQEEQKGNSIIQYGVWLKVIISTERNTQDSQVSNSVSSGGGGSSRGLQNKTIKENNSLQKKSVEESKEGVYQDIESENNGITGSVVGGFSNKSIIALISLAVLTALLFVNYKRKK